MADFLVSYDLFQRLTGFTSGEWGLYDINSSGIQSTITEASVERHSREVEAEIALRDHIKDAYLAWPISGSELLAWQDKNMHLDLPDWYKLVVEARDLDTARTILDEALKAAQADEAEKVSVLSSTPKKQVKAHFFAKIQRNEASRKVRAVEGCMDAIQVDAVAGIAARPRERRYQAQQLTEAIKPMTPKERGRQGGFKGNAANRTVRAKIVAAYKAGDFKSKNAAAIILAVEFGRSESAVRTILKNVDK